MERSAWPASGSSGSSSFPRWPGTNMSASSGWPMSSCGGSTGVAPLEPHHAPTGIRYGRVALGGESLEELASAAGRDDVPFSLEEEIEAVQWLHTEAAAHQRAAADRNRDRRPLAGAGDAPAGAGRAAPAHAQGIRPVHHHAFLQRRRPGDGDGRVPRLRAAGGASRWAWRRCSTTSARSSCPPRCCARRAPTPPRSERSSSSTPVEGARLIMTRHRNLDLAAVVAYEHHMRFDGGGYPSRTFPRRGALRQQVGAGLRRVRCAGEPAALPRGLSPRPCHGNPAGGPWHHVRSGAGGDVHHDARPCPDEMGVDRRADRGGFRHDRAGIVDTSSPSIG